MNSTQRNSLVIPQDIHDAMVAHCVRDAPLEACGLLGGYPPFVSTFHPLTNALASEVRYSADGRELIAAIQSLRLQKKDVVAIYHSHPRSPAIPSRTDLAENFEWGTVPRIIVSLQDSTPVVRIWRLDPESYEELSWRITPGSV